MIWQKMWLVLQTTTTRLWSYHSISLVSAIFILLALVAMNNKLIFLLSLAYVGLLFLLTRSFEQTLIYSFIPMSLIGVGQLYKIVAISPEELNHPLYPEGQSLFFTYSPFFALQIAMVIGYIVEIVRRKGSLRLSWSILILLVAYFFQFSSALQSQFFPMLSLLSVGADFGVFCWGLLLITTYLHLEKNSKKRVLSQLIELLVIVILVESAVVLAQLVTRNTLGLTLEQTQLVPYFGAGADENALQFRPVGFETHANQLANKFVNYLFGFLFLWLKLDHKGRKHSVINAWLEKLSFIAIVMVILVSQSRSAYMALGIAGVILWFFFRKEMHQVQELAVKHTRKYPIIIGLLCVWIFIIIFDRARLSWYSFGSAGGWGVRELLAEESINLFWSQPWLGIGKGSFIPAAFQQNPTGVMSYFPEAVHNGFLLYLVESGALSFFSAVAGWFVLVRESVKTNGYSQHTGTLLAYLAAMSMMMLFQPFINFIPWGVAIATITRESNEEKV